jgi:hypothetical protein
LLLGQTTELIGRLGVFRIYTAYGFEPAGVTSKNIGEIAIVPAVVDDLDKDGAIDRICLHELEQRFDRGILGWRMRALREGEGGIMFPDVHMRVDQKRSFAGERRGK